jgi:glycosyltransferase involved in cell wall biosynthesis
VAWKLGLDPRGLSSLWALLRRLQRTHKRDIVLHAHDSHALALAAIPARALGIPLIATRRSMTPPGRLWRLPDRVIAISNAVEQVLRRVGVEPARIIRIPSAVSLADMAKISIESHGPGPGDGVPVVLAVGALSAEKGHATLIEALPLLRREVPRAHLVVVGDGPERRRLEALARQLRITGGVRFLGDRPTASSLICAAQVLAQPSHREALGTAVLEAMALGTPVVATATGGLVELLGEGAGLLVPPGDPEALAESLARVLTDALLRAALVHEARARVADYDSPGVADRVAEVYRSALRKI